MKALHFASLARTFETQTWPAASAMRNFATKVGNPHLTKHDVVYGFICRDDLLVFNWLLRRMVISGSLLYIYTYNNSVLDTSCCLGGRW